MTVSLEGLQNELARFVIVLRSGIRNSKDSAVHALGCRMFVFLVSHFISLAIRIIGQVLAGLIIALLLL